MVQSMQGPGVVTTLKLHGWQWEGLGMLRVWSATLPTCCKANVLHMQPRLCLQSTSDWDTLMPSSNCTACYTANWPALPMLPT